MTDFEKKNWSWVYGELLFVSEFNDLITKTFIYVSNLGPSILIKTRGYVSVAFLLLSLYLFFLTALFLSRRFISFFWPLYFVVAALNFCPHFSFLLPIYFVVAALVFCRHYRFLLSVKQWRKYKVGKNKSGKKMIKWRQQKIEATKKYGTARYNLSGLLYKKSPNKDQGKPWFQWGVTNRDSEP